MCIRDSYSGEPNLRAKRWRERYAAWTLVDSPLTHYCKRHDFTRVDRVLCSLPLPLVASMNPIVSVPMLSIPEHSDHFPLSLLWRQEPRGKSQVGKLRPKE
eukprot:2670852-Amphidinium_carterae.2